jgi:hypothetical protein
MAKKAYSVIPFNGDADRKIKSVIKNGIKAKGGQIILFHSVYSKDKVHLPTEILNAKDPGSQYVLVEINAKGITGKLIPEDENTEILLQPLIKPQYIIAADAETISEKMIEGNLTAKLKAMTAKKVNR